MQQSENLARRTDIRAAEIDREVQCDGGVATNGCCGQCVRGRVQADVSGGVVRGSDGVVFEVWTIDGLFIGFDGLKERNTEILVRACRADGVVGSV